MIDKIKTVLFTVIITAVFALLVSGVNAALERRIATNQLVAKQRVILDLLGLVTSEQKLAPDEIKNMFSENVETATMFKKSAMEGFKLKNGNKNLLICSFSGQGFWDTIKGYIAIDTSATSIQGIEFTQHGETPGLGGRISEKEFKKRFNNKSFDQVRDDDLRLKFVAEGTASRADEIDGITGASGTTAALEKIVNQTLEKILQITKKGAAN
jgi:Na+-transporting NADH:ubiquinone oxidoreductase subunit C